MPHNAMQSYEIRPARTRRELDVMIGNAASVFQVHEGLFRDGVLRSPGHKLSHTRLAIYDGGIAGGVDVLHRVFRINGSNVPVGGIADVHTLPQFRGRGMAGALMRDAISYMKSRGYLLSVLFANLHDFYGKFGYACAPRPFYSIKSDAQAARDRTIICRRSDYLESIPLLRDMYRDSDAPTRGLALRTPAYWAGIPMMHRHRKPFSIIADVQDMPAGMIVLEPDAKKSRLLIGECHAPGAHPEAVCNALLREALDAVRGSGCESLGGFFPWQHPMAQAMLEHGGAMQPNNDLMALVLDPEALASATGITGQDGRPMDAAPAFLTRACANTGGFIMWDDDKF
jgi:predicted N-acetyltransferase YhbS